jgi:hypothetical protein
MIVTEFRRTARTQRPSVYAGRGCLRAGEREPGGPKDCHEELAGEGGREGGGGRSE